MTGVRGQLTIDEVTHHRTVAALNAVFVFLDDYINHLVVGEDLHGAEVDLALQCRSSGQLQLLACLSTGVVGAGDLHTTEGTGGQSAAVFASERGTNGVHVVDHANGFVGQTPAVDFTAAVVAALDGVFDVAVRAVVIHLLTASGVHTTLCGDGVRTTGCIVVGEGFDIVSEFAEGCGSTSTSQAGADNNNAELTTVQRGHQVVVVFLPLPSILGGHADGSVGAQNRPDGHAINARSGSGELGTGGGFRVSAH